MIGNGIHIWQPLALNAVTPWLGRPDVSVQTYVLVPNGLKLTPISSEPFWLYAPSVLAYLVTEPEILCGQNLAGVILDNSLAYYKHLKPWLYLKLLGERFVLGSDVESLKFNKILRRIGINESPILIARWLSVLAPNATTLQDLHHPTWNLAEQGIAGFMSGLARAK